MPKSLRTPRHRQLLALLVDARKEKGLTQADVAATLEKPQSFVAKYENSERRIDVIEFIDIAAALGIAPADILAQIGPPERPGRRITRRSRQV
jgi:transcriptional regulator with XRE-family HTH domain